MRDRERGDDDDQRPQPPERDDEADQEQQMVGAFEDVPEPGHHEAPRCLVPAGIEAHETEKAEKIERADGAARRQEAQHRRYIAAEAIELEADREFRVVGSDGIFKQHVEQLLVPVELEVVGECSYEANDLSDGSDTRA